MHAPTSAQAPEAAIARLAKLLDYIGEVVRLDDRPAFRLADHRLATGQRLVLHRHEAAALPGATLDVSDDDGPVWLRLERLKRIDPPAPSESAAPWLEVSPDPDDEPVGRAFLIRTVPPADKEALVASGEARAEDCDEAAAEPGAFDVRLRLEDRPAVAAAIETYRIETWRAWAEAERPRRRAMALYQKLFELAQLADLGGPDEPFELVWGMGLARWRIGAREIDLPLVERLVEIEIDETAGAQIRVRPRALPAAVSLRPYEELKVEGAMLAGDAARRALAAAEADEGVSPFRIEDVEPALRACQARLAASGRYEPDTGAAGIAEPPPEAGEQLLVTDRWVLFARRRSDSFILKDIDTLKEAVDALEAASELPAPARTLVSGPGDGPADAAWQPLGNEIGATGPEPSSAPDDVGASGDLFFPKPFNDDQIEIVRRLEQAEGLVVQGPPGTGKTHTIANVICHMMATGRRVLVVSHGEPALAVLRSQLPEGVRDLAISITATERDGLRQLETAVRLLQSIVEGLRPGEQLARIRDAEAAVVHLRARLAAIDAEMAQIATRQLEAAPSSGKRAAELAAEVAAKRDRFAWFSDRPRTFAAGSGLADAGIDRLRTLRASLGSRLEHGDALLPAVADLPDGAALGRLHADLVHARALQERAAADPEFPVRLATAQDRERARGALDAIATLALVRQAVERPWLAAVADDAREGGSVLAGAVRAFIDAARPILGERGHWLAMPIEVSEAVTSSAEAVAIVARLAAGEAVFGLFALRERRHRTAVDAIRIGGRPPSAPADWAQVRDHLAWRASLDALHLRWAALGAEVGAPVPERPSARALEQVVADLELALQHGPAALDALGEACRSMLPGQAEALALAADPERLGRVEDALHAAVAAAELATAKQELRRVAQSFGPRAGALGALARELIEDGVGRVDLVPDAVARLWDGVRTRMDDLARHRAELDAVGALTEGIAAAGAPDWASRLRGEPPEAAGDWLLPPDWREAWDWAAAARYLDDIDGQATLRALADERLEHDDALRRTFEGLVRDRTFYALSRNMTGKVKAALMMFATALRRTGKGTGKGAARHRREARDAMAMCYDAIPCWIMPSWRVSEQLPGRLGAFDLVVMDEASQSDIRELPALLRGKKILVVGDDKQVSPTAAFIETAKLDRLEHGFLKDMPFRTLLLPGSSLYDLAKVMFPDRLVMLKEHFRCVEPIIRFSVPFYPEPLIPLRIPTAQERLDPPLIDIYVPDGRREGDKLNPREARVVVDEIKALVADPVIARIPGAERWRSIGVVSLIGAKQAALINKMLVEELGEEAMLRHRIACGDSATFQGNERDVVFLSMVADPTVKAAQTAMHFEQRFNVALSRARDRLVLVRSIREEELNPNDLKARVIRHFREPMARAGPPSADLEAACESDFERALLRRLTKRGYRVRPQVGALGFRIDLVVEGADDRRLAIECDGDRYHGPERWADDMRRQRTLERVGWRFWRLWASSFALYPDGCEAELVAALDRLGIAPLGADAPARLYTRHRTAAPVGSSAPPAREAPAKNGAGIRVGDRAAVRFLDDDKIVTLTLHGARHDPVNGLTGAETPLGSALLGLSDEDEGAYVEDGRERRILVMRVETSGPARRPAT